MFVPVHKYLTGRSAVKITSGIEAAIREGRLAPGDALPPVRALAETLGISPTTVASVYRTLQTRGLVVSRGRAGTRVSLRPPLPVAANAPLPRDVRDLATGNPDPALLPPLGPALARLDPAARLYDESPSLPALLRLAAESFRADRLPVGTLAILSGALDGIERVLEAHLRPGDRVAVEDPGFSRVIDLLRALGLVPVPVALDDAGPRPDSLEKALRDGAEAFVLTPRAQNPTGAALDAHRARELSRVLRAFPDVLVVEDDHAGPIAGTPAFTVCDAKRTRWAIVRSVSKFLGPDLRVAFLNGDATTVSRVEGRRLLGPGWVSGVLQRLVVALWSDPAVGRKLADATRRYEERRRALVDALARRGIAAHARSGLNVWVPVPSETPVVQSLLQSGYAVSPGERFRLSASPAVRVTVAALPPAEADRVAEAIASAVAPAQRTPAT